MLPRAKLQRSHRSAGALLGSATCFGLTIAHLAMAWTLVFTMRIGPVIGAIDARAERGMHSGDLLAIPLVLVALFLYCQGVAGIHRSGLDRRLRHRVDEGVVAPVIRIRPASVSLPALQRSAA